LVIVAVALPGLALAACGSGASASMSAYFESLEELNADIRAQQQQVDADYDEALAATEFSPAARQGFSDYLTAQQDLALSYVAGAEDLDPPDDARALHEEAIEAYRAFAGEIDAVISDVSRAQTLDGLVSALGAPAAIEAAANATAACLALQNLAEDEDVSVDLRCQE
jgi:hypothetical protein